MATPNPNITSSTGVQPALGNGIGPFSRPYEIVDVGSLYQTDRATLNRAATPAGPVQATVAGVNTALPIVYGTARVGARIIGAVVYNGNLVLRCAWCIGEVDAVSAVYLNDEALPAGVTATHYTGTTTQTVNSTLVSAYAANGKAYGDTLAGDGATRPGVCYSVIVIPPGVSSGFPRLVAEIRGMKVSSTEGGAKAYSTNPAYALADFIESPVYGMGRAVDWTTVATVAAACSATVGGEAKRLLGLVLANPQACETWLNVLREYAGCWAVPEGSKYRLIADALPATGAVGNITGISKAAEARLTFTSHTFVTGDIVRIADVVGMTQINGAVSVVQYVSGTQIDLTGIDSTGYGTWTSGGTATKIETSAAQFTVDNVLGSSLRAAKRGVLQAPTVVEVVYTDTSVTPWRDGVATRYLPGVLEGTAPRRASRISMPGITRYSEAYRWATERLNAATLGDLTVTFTAFDAAITLQVGDLIDVTHPVGLTAKILRVTKIDPVEVGRWSITGVEWDPAMYSSEVVTGPSVSDTVLPSPTDPDVPADLTLTEEGYQIETGRWASRIRATWSAGLYPYVGSYAVTVSSAGQTVASVLLPNGSTVYATPPLAEYQTYQVAVAIISLLGARGEDATATLTTTGKATVPSDVLSVAGVVVDRRLTVTWEPAIDLDLAAHELRYGAVGGSWSTATLLDRVPMPSLRYESTVLPEGAWVIYVKGLDAVKTEAHPYGQESVNVASVTVTVMPQATETSTVSTAIGGLFLYNMTSHTDKFGEYYVSDAGQTWTTLFPSAMDTYASCLWAYNNGYNDSGLCWDWALIYATAIPARWTATLDWTAYDPNASITEEFGTLVTLGTDGKVVTAATNATPVEITTSVAHGWRTGDFVWCWSFSGNTAPDSRMWRIQVLDAYTFRLYSPNGAPCVGNGAFSGTAYVNKEPFLFHSDYPAAAEARYATYALRKFGLGALQFRLPLVIRGDFGQTVEVGTGAVSSTLPLTVATTKRPYAVAVAVTATSIGESGYYAVVNQREVQGAHLINDQTSQWSVRVRGDSGSTARCYINVGDFSTFEFGNGASDVDFSIECWVYFDGDTANEHQTIISKGGLNSSGIMNEGEWCLFRRTSTHEITFARYDVSSGGYSAIDAAPLDNGRWYHVAVARISGTAIYVDGVASGGGTASSSYTAMETTAVPVIIGNTYNAGAYSSPMNGKVADVRIWSDGRTAQEVLDNHQTWVAANAANLIASWRVTETTGSTLTDSQTNVTAHNGTLGNGTTFNSETAMSRFWRPLDGFDVALYDAGGSRQAGTCGWTFTGV